MAVINRPTKETTINVAGFDIETDTTIDGRDPRVGQIVSIAVYSPGFQAVVDGGSEQERIHRFCEVLDKMPQSIVCSWNGSVFDGPYLADRARMAGIDIGFVLDPDPAINPKYAPLPGHAGGYRLRLRRHEHADMAYAYRDYALGDPSLGRAAWSLKSVCRSLGIEMIEVDRERIHELTAEQNRAYNLSDARGTYLLAERLGTGLQLWVDHVPPAGG